MSITRCGGRGSPDPVHRSRGMIDQRFPNPSELAHNGSEGLYARGVITPTIRPGVLSLGEHFSGSFGTYKAQIRLFLVLMLIPALVMTAAILIVSVIAVAVQNTAPRDSGGPAMATVVGFLLAYFIGLVFALRYQAMMSLATHDLSRGHVPTRQELTERTRGFFGRITAVLGIALVLAFILSIIVLFLIVLPLSTAIGAPPVGPILLAILLYLASVFGGFFLSIRWLYFVPAMGIEQAPGIPALRRSWALTRGVFWITVGFSFLASLAASVPLLIPYLMVAMASAAAEGTGTLSAGLLIVMIIGLLLMLAATVVALPFWVIFITTMYLSRTRKLAGEPPSAAWRQPAPSMAPHPPAGPPPAPTAQPPYPSPQPPHPTGGVSYEQQPPGFDQQTPGFGHQLPDYGHQSPGYGQQPPGASPQASPWARPPEPPR
ncbi:MAG: glycerophosphoryl diester phosphodiesterase membrane domain-containing protein [Propioniciclava sp.]